MEILYPFVVFYALWLMYVLAMSFKRHWPGLGFVAKALAAPVVVVGFVLDVSVHLLSSVVFLDLPREVTLSHRLKRYNRNPSTRAIDRYRRCVAGWVCTRLLDQFDPDGDHC